MVAETSTELRLESYPRFLMFRIAEDVEITMSR